MNYLIHGDYHLASRKYLIQLIDQFKNQGQENISLNGQNLSLNEIIQSLSSNSLFEEKKFIVIENLFSRLKSKQQIEILDWLKNYSGDNQLILWEKKSIGKILQRKLPQNTQVKEFKTPVIIFKLVEAIMPKNKQLAINLLNSALQKEAAEFIFTMIARQIRLLLMAKGGQKITGPTWMIAKFKTQAESFSQEKLLQLYQNLYIIDKEIKTGQTIMPLNWHLTVWLSQI